MLFEGRIAVPSVQSLKDVILKEAHDTPLSIHPGSTKMYQDLKTMYWWSGMSQVPPTNAKTTTRPSSATIEAPQAYKKPTPQATNQASTQIKNQVP